MEALKALKPLSGSKIYFYKNGECQGLAFEDIYQGAYFPAVSMFKSTTVTVNFGPNFKHPPDIPHRGVILLLLLLSSFVFKLNISICVCVYILDAREIGGRNRRTNSGGHAFFHGKFWKIKIGSLAVRYVLMMDFTRLPNTRKGAGLRGGLRGERETL